MEIYYIIGNIIIVAVIVSILTHFFTSKNTSKSTSKTIQKRAGKTGVIDHHKFKTSTICIVTIFIVLIMLFATIIYVNFQHRKTVVKIWNVKPPVLSAEIK